MLKESIIVLLSKEMTLGLMTAIPPEIHLYQVTPVELAPMKMQTRVHMGHKSLELSAKDSLKRKVFNISPNYKEVPNRKTMLGLTIAIREETLISLVMEMLESMLQLLVLVSNAKDLLRENHILLLKMMPGLMTATRVEIHTSLATVMLESMPQLPLELVLNARDLDKRKRIHWPNKKMMRGSMIATQEEIHTLLVMVMLA